MIKCSQCGLVWDDFVDFSHCDCGAHVDMNCFPCDEEDEVRTFTSVMHDMCRCHDTKCGHRLRCKRFLARNSTGSESTPNAHSLADFAGGSCRSFMKLEPGGTWLWWNGEWCPVDIDTLVDVELDDKRIATGFARDVDWKLVRAYRVASEESRKLRMASDAMSKVPKVSVDSDLV